MKTNTICLALVIVLLCPIASAQWVLTNGPKGVYLYAFAASGSYVFAGSDTSSLAYFGGSVFLSTNNGTDWTNVSAGLVGPAVHALAINGTNIFAGTGGNGVFVSTNNGTNWTAVNTGLTNKFVNVLAASGTYLFAGTTGGWDDITGGVFRSTDTGASWTKVNTGLTNTVVLELAVLGTKLFAGTPYGGLFVSTDNGTSWTRTSLNASYVGALAVSGTNIFASAQGGLFLSPDTGVTWTKVSDVGAMDLVTSGPNLFALGRSFWGSVSLSTDNGAHWELVNENMMDTLTLALGINDTYIFAGGSSGDGIWRRPLSEMLTSVDQGVAELPHDFLLSQNYPNPFNPRTTIRYELPKSSDVRLSVYDMLGREVVVLMNERRNAGVHEVKFDGSGLASGLYLYRLQTGDFVATKRLLFLK